MTTDPLPPAGGRRTDRLCADIGGSFIKFARADPDASLFNERREATPARDWPAFCAALAALCRDAPGEWPLLLSVAGTIDPATGLANSANIPCISGRRLAAELAAALGRAVTVANDADCFVLAEALDGAGRGHRVVFGAILGTGVGGGLVVDGRIMAGAGGVSGEWGHGPVLGTRLVNGVEVPAFPCGCGQRGCIDTVGGARGIERLDRLLNGGGRSCDAILAAWTGGEGEAGATVALWLDLVAGPLAFVLNVCGASLVPVGGGLSGSAALVAALDGAVRQQTLRGSDEPVVVPARLGSRAGLLGAARLRSHPPA